MKASVFTLGCKVNETESASLMAALADAGWEVTAELCPADLYILNTCAVTREAEKKSRQLVARARKFNPAAAVFVCGCASEKDKGAFIERDVDFVTGARKKEEILSAVAERFGGRFGALPYPVQSRTRAFVKIQDGCNNFCSYCIIPYLRGRETSRPIADILTEIGSCGCPEIVLNGINISSYEGGLASLAAALAGVKKRIRLGSLECGAITEELLAALGGLYDFAPQFHLSLQSGSTAVLRAMNRHYTREEYLAKCRLIYSRFPEAAITTDIIAGFPTESEEDFCMSLSMIEEAGFARVHVFPYSAREGTAAFRLAELPAAVKKERTERLLRAAKGAAERYAARFLGRKLDFIAEEHADGYTTGYTANYIKVYLRGEYACGKKYDIRLLSPYGDGVSAELYED